MTAITRHSSLSEMVDVSFYIWNAISQPQRIAPNVASEIVGEALLVSEGLLAKVKCKLRITPEAESWLAVTGVANPLLAQLDRFKTLWWNAFRT